MKKVISLLLALAILAMGVAAFDPQTDSFVSDTVRRADKIMYANKRARKDASC